MTDGNSSAPGRVPDSFSSRQAKPGSMSTLIAEATILKVLARWAPYARHDVMGGLSPMSMDVAALAARSARGTLSAEDISKFVTRMKDSLKHVAVQAEGVSIMVGQDRKARVDVGEVARDITQKMNIRFASIACELETDDPGQDIRYDLQIILLAVLMALEDRRGLALRVVLRVRRDEQRVLSLDIRSTPLQDESWIPLRPPEDGRRRIDFADLECLAAYLGFQFSSTADGATLTRASQD
jgi:hypothetical protein